MHAWHVIRRSGFARTQSHVGGDEQVIVRHDADERARHVTMALDDTQAHKVIDGERANGLCELSDRDVEVEDEELHESAERSVLRELPDLDRDPRRTRDDLVAAAERFADLLPGEGHRDEHVAQTAYEVGLVEWKRGRIHRARC